MVGNNQSRNFALCAPAGHEPIAQFARRLLNAACAQRCIASQNFMRQADPSAGFGHKAHFLSCFFSQTMVDADDVKLGGIGFFCAAAASATSAIESRPPDTAKAYCACGASCFTPRENAARWSAVFSQDAQPTRAFSICTRLAIACGAWGNFTANSLNASQLVFSRPLPPVSCPI